MNASAAASALASIIGPMSTPASRPLPTLSAFTRATSACTKRS